MDVMTRRGDSTLGERWRKEGDERLVQGGMVWRRLFDLLGILSIEREPAGRVTRQRTAVSLTLRLTAYAAKCTCKV